MNHLNNYDTEYVIGNTFNNLAVYKVYPQLLYKCCLKCMRLEATMTFEYPTVESNNLILYKLY